MPEGVHDVGDPGEDEVIRGGEGHRDLRGEPGDCVANAFGAGFPNPDGVATVRIEGWARVPTV